MNKHWRIMTCLVLSLAVSGCAQLSYYMQAAHGQLSLLNSAHPINQLLESQDTDGQLKDRLIHVKQIRAFAVEELGLPDNDSYTAYADVKRPYVLWNVVATPELSLVPVQWCFPIAGCVDYRGYYDYDDALVFGTGLRKEGYDVQIAGVPAYSTLGWFHDPVLSTFVGYSQPEVARMIFHELAHQVVYAKGDSQFNESFATTVEEEGLQRWMTQFGTEQMRQSHAVHVQRQEEFLNLLLKYRAKLAANYARKVSDDEKRQQKVAIFKDLQDDYQTLKSSWGGYTGYDHWFAEPLSNAYLASVATYHDFVPAFKELLRQEQTFPKFYEAVRALSELGKAERHRHLSLLTPVADSAH